MSEAQNATPGALAAERAINEQYRTRLHRWLEETARLAAEFTTLGRNSIWLSGTVGKGKRHREIHPIVGRVALEPNAEPLVEGELYIGPWIHEFEGVTVVSWAAPIAKLFYEGRRSTDAAASSVLGRRTFTTAGVDLTGFADDLEPGVSGYVFTVSGSATIEVPEAPKPVRRPRPRPAPKPTTVGTDEDTATKPARAQLPAPRPTPPPPDVPTVDEPTPAAMPPEKPPVPAPATPVPAVPAAAPVPAAGPDRQTEELRAEDVVLEIIDRPRTGQLHSVLATLQPDQYELVTWPADRPLIVDGQPGTGKTVVAMHRAAYLTHHDRPGGPLDRVAVIGPTDEYRDHVRLLSESVGGANVPVHGLPSFLARLAGIDLRNMTPGPNDRVGVQWNILSTVRKAARIMNVPASGDKGAFGPLVRALIQDGAIHRRAVTDPELSKWLFSIGNFQKATSETRFLPFLAAAGIAVMPIAQERIDHLIVDEAQDVPPLVWLILLALLRDGGSLSLFGDLNQRRSDWTLPSWQQLAEDLQLTDDHGEAPVRNLQIGYRSTRQILKFANRLLPSAERSNHALREGVRPHVERVPQGRLIDEVLMGADRLSQRHPEGLTAVITRDPRPVSDAFRNAGWKRPPVLRDAWQRDGRVVFVFHPDRARGLEFDGVVVVEPGAFPKNFGRDGVLYTSLTRATQELSVIYSGALPKNLRLPR